MSAIHDITLAADMVNELRHHKSVIVDVPGGKLQLCGPGGFVMEFADATNAYLCVADLDLIEGHADGAPVTVAGVQYRVRMEFAA